MNIQIGVGDTLYPWIRFLMILPSQRVPPR
jgi:hypothetical protein